MSFEYKLLVIGTFIGFGFMLALAYANLQWMKTVAAWQKHQDEAILSILDQLDAIDK